MLEPKIIKDEPEKIRKMLKDRAVDFDFDKMLELGKKRRSLMQETDELRKKRNQMSIAIGKAKKSNEDASKLLSEMGEISKELDDLEQSQKSIESSYTNLAFSIPNMIHKSVPIGPDESANVEVRKWGETPKFDFDIKGHEEIAEKLDILDIQRASKIAGARFYYLKGDLVKLANAITSFAFEFLSEKGYKLIQPPYMINRKSMEGAVIAEDFEDVIYKIQDDDLYLIGTSEHAIVSMYSDEILEGKSLPDRFGSISPCFRKEAGAHGKDQKGIFRVHQFEKFEQFVFSKPEDSDMEQDKMIGNAEEFYQKLEIPHRVVLLSSGDMGKVAAKTFDIEAWMPGQNAYREICSVSNCNDFQARRLKIRFRDKTNEETQYVHTLNGTLVAIERTMVAIIENFQTNDGHIKIPKVLQKYFGKDKI
uniref:Serine--tRNA ligase n=1 Tax=uncultured marine thaumarchaeote KM3_37_D10 TaxID=1456137 RepID=A0A075H2S8_9ARCH|nr:seryl-tRNA synthetase (SARS, serS) [uncultured marine thaumarchaeote KM3_37_D10]